MNGTEYGCIVREIQTGDDIDTAALSFVLRGVAGGIKATSRDPVTTYAKMFYQARSLPDRMLDLRASDI